MRSTVFFLHIDTCSMSEHRKCLQPYSSSTSKKASSLWSHFWTVTIAPHACPLVNRQFCARHPCQPARNRIHACKRIDRRERLLCLTSSTQAFTHHLHILIVTCQTHHNWRMHSTLDKAVKSLLRATNKPTHGLNFCYKLAPLSRLLQHGI